MHELALVESLVATVEENVAEGRVTAVRLAVGRLAAVVPDAMRFCFELCVRGTRLEGAVLEIEEVAGRGGCEACGREESVSTFFTPCPGCGGPLRVIAGTELRLDGVEVV